jgi:hypothetical protein
LLQELDEPALREAVTTCAERQYLEDRGEIDALRARYPGLRRYVPAFFALPFHSEPGSGAIATGLDLIRQLDTGTLKTLPAHTPMVFVPGRFRAALHPSDATVDRPTWELGLTVTSAMASDPATSTSRKPTSCLLSKPDLRPHTLDEGARPWPRRSPRWAELTQSLPHARSMMRTSGPDATPGEPGRDGTRSPAASFRHPGTFQTGDYEEIMHKATCPSLLSNAALVWNTVQMSRIVDQLRARGETITDEELADFTLGFLSYHPQRHLFLPAN